MLRSVGNIDSLVYGEAGDFAEIVVDVSTERTNSVRAEGNALVVLMICFKKHLFTVHNLTTFPKSIYTFNLSYFRFIVNTRKFNNALKKVLILYSDYIIMF